MRRGYLASIRSMPHPLLTGWALALASGPATYAAYMGVLASIPGRLVMFGLTIALFFHLAAGVRHLSWDFGQGFHPKTASATAWLAFAFALAASIAVWGFALSGTH